MFLSFWKSHRESHSDPCQHRRQCCRSRGGIRPSAGRSLRCHRVCSGWEASLKNKSSLENTWSQLQVISKNVNLSCILTSVLAGLITEDLVWRIEGVGSDQVHLGVCSSTTEDVLTLLTWVTQENYTKWFLWYCLSSETTDAACNDLFKAVILVRS